MLLGDRYELQEHIGRGGMATVYRGHDLHTGKPIAIKVLREAYQTDGKMVRRFQQNAERASRLHHDNIVQVYDWERAEGAYYTVMELVEGQNLRDYLQVNGVLTTDRATRILYEVAQGLEEVHRHNLIYQTLSTRKILLGEDGAIKLAMVTTDPKLGHTHYCPDALLPLKRASDMYALGCVFYEMLTGKAP